MKEIKFKFAFIILSLSLVLLAFWSFPSADDYSFFTDLRERGLIDFCINYYKTWSGRLLSTFLFSIGFVNVSTVFNLKYFIVLFSIIFALLPWWLIKILKIKSSYSLILITQLAIYIGLRRSIGEIVYWYTGAAVYLLPLSIALLFLSSNKSFLYTENREKFSQKFFTGALSFLAGNAFELTTAGLWALWVYRVRKPNKLITDGYFILFNLGFLLFVVSPGNLNRKLAQDKFLADSHASWFNSILKLFNQMLWPALTALLLFLAIKYLYKNKTSDLKSLFQKHDALVFSFFYLLPCFLSPHSVEGRTLFPLGIFWVIFILDKFARNISSTITAKKGLLILLIAAYLYVFCDLARQHYLARSTQLYLVSRDEYISKIPLEKRKNMDVKFPAYARPLARLMPRSEAQKNKTYWINNAISSYYGIKSLELTED